MGRVHPILFLPYFHYDICAKCIERTENDECPWCYNKIEMVRFPGGHFSMMEAVIEKYQKRKLADSDNVVNCLSSVQALTRRIVYTGK